MKADFFEDGSMEVHGDDGYEAKAMEFAKACWEMWTTMLDVVKKGGQRLSGPHHAGVPQAGQTAPEGPGTSATGQSRQEGDSTVPPTPWSTSSRGVGRAGSRDPTPRRLGIAFSDPLVLAIGRGGKTVTRRILPMDGAPWYRDEDELYVREAYRADVVDDTPAVRYRADGAAAAWPDRIMAHHSEVLSKNGWRPPRFMFRALARHWLRVLETRIEPLQAITLEEAHAEGIHDVDAFRSTWDRLHRDAGGRWADNPYVQVIRFRRLAEVELCVACGEPLIGADQDFCWAVRGMKPFETAGVKHPKDRSPVTSSVTLGMNDDEAQPDTGALMVWRHKGDASEGHGITLDELALRNLGYACINAAEELQRRRHDRGGGT